jgi:hypothetical protein
MPTINTVKVLYNDINLYFSLSLSYFSTCQVLGKNPILKFNGRAKLSDFSGRIIGVFNVRIATRKCSLELAEHSHTQCSVPVGYHFSGEDLGPTK